MPFSSILFLLTHLRTFNFLRIRVSFEPILSWLIGSTPKTASNPGKRGIFPGWSFLILGQWLWCFTSLSNALNKDLKRYISLESWRCLFQLFFNFECFSLSLIGILGNIKGNNSKQLLLLILSLQNNFDLPHFFLIFFLTLLIKQSKPRENQFLMFKITYFILNR